MASSFSWLLAAALVKSSAILIVALAIAVAMRRRSAEERHLLWAVAVASLLLLPALSMTLPSFHPPASTFRPGDALPAPTGVLEGSVSEAAAQAAPTVLPSSATMPVAIRLGADAAFIVSVIYGVVAGFLLLTLCIKSLCVTRLTRGFAEVTDRYVLDLVEALRREHGVRRRIRIRVSDVHQTPWVWGCRNPILVLPRGFGSWTEDDRRNAVIHEISHIARFDLPVLMIARICCALYWFQPLAWLAARCLADEAENACDDRVLQRGASRSGYARQLVALAREIRDGTAASSPALPMAAGSAIKRRIELILDTRTRRANVNTTKIVLAAIAALCVVGPLASLRSQETTGESRPNTALDADALRRIAAAGPQDSAELEALVADYLNNDMHAQAASTMTDYLMRPENSDDLECGYCASLLKTEGLVSKPELKDVLLPAFDEVERRAYETQSGELFLRLAEISIASRNRTAVARGARYLLEAFRIGGASDEGRLLRVKYLIEMQQYAAAKSLAEQLREDPSSSWYQSETADGWISYIDNELKRSEALSNKLLVADRGTLPSDDYLPLVKTAPIYPQSALESKTQGYAVVQFTVTATGRTADIVVVESTDGVFDQASIDAAEQFVYMPKLIDGVPVATNGVKNKITYEMN